MSNLTLVETVNREPLQFVLSPYDNHRLQFTLQVSDIAVCDNFNVGCSGFVCFWFVYPLSMHRMSQKSSGYIFSEA